MFLGGHADDQVREKVIYFDFGILLWRFHSLDLQSHLSDAGVDVYLERLLKSLPKDVMSTLSVRRAGFHR